MKKGFVATIGFFDGVHRGHRHLIKQVTDEAERRGLNSLLVTFDRHPRSVFAPGTEPLNLTTTEEKTALLHEMGADHIHFLKFDREMAGLSAFDFMKDVLRDELGVKVLVTGYDHHFGRAVKEGEGFDDYLAYGLRLGIDVVQATELDGGEHVSSSAIRKALQDGDVTTARRMLGRPYSWSGTVVHGQAIGRTLGFPTANLECHDKQKLLPARGAYAVWADVKKTTDGKTECRKAGAMLNIGNRPTVDGGHMSVEAHLIGINENLYGQELTLHFVERLRAERRFDSEAELAEQLDKDRLSTLKILQL